ncbi:MAG: HPr family phosphocarrier protein [Spirochaetae bacterium HGW-Spirochaetae-3]|jgi:phosphocarrier protein|nr:MAG: HPr family phosphocarrier protein [Spirochaetae bacterium HGW-Spirochaetae-3]
MKSFDYVMTAPEGIHSRPAGALVKKAQEFESEILVSFGGKSANARKLFALMKLGVKRGDTVSVTAEGADEELASSAMADFLASHF